MTKSFKIIKPGLILILICCVITALVVIVNGVTEDKIAQQNEQKTALALQSIIEANRYQDVTEQYDEINLNGSTAEKVYEAIDENGNCSGTIFLLSEKGYGGDVWVMIGIDPNGKVIHASAVDVSTETPGLGQETAKSDFIDQFDGISSTVEVGKEIDAQTGATISSKAITGAVNRAIELFEGRR